MLSKEVIAELEKDGWKRWTQYDFDRMYFHIDKSEFMEISYYHTGGICSSCLDGKDISHSRAYWILSVTCWIDVETEKMHFRYGDDVQATVVKEYAEKSLEKAQKQARQANSTVEAPR